MKRKLTLVLLSLAAGVIHSIAASITTVDYNPIGIPYGLKVELDENSSVVAPPDHVGAWSWDEDGFPATAKGWTHTSKWVQLELAKPALFTLTLESAAGVSWPSAEDATRVAGTNLFPSFTLYRGWDTDAGVLPQRHRVEGGTGFDRWLAAMAATPSSAHVTCYPNSLNRCSRPSANSTMA